MDSTILRAPTELVRLRLQPTQSPADKRDKPKFTGRWHYTGGILCTNTIVPRRATASRTALAGFDRTARGGMTKKHLVSVVDDDRFCRESMCRLMRSLGYAVEMFPSAADFLASSRFAETACLIADVQMPAMTGPELYRRLIDTGHTIPTILVTAFPNDVDRARALSDGVVCYLSKPVDEGDLTRCVSTALNSGGSPDREP